jgi:serine/threonine-protein kinase RsbT
MPPAWSYAAEEAIAIRRDADVALVQARARAFAREVGLGVRAQWAVAIAASELATNVLKFGAPGQLTLRVCLVPPPALEIEAVDCGPGFTDTERALRDGVSEGIDRAALDALPPARRGLGLGLGAVRRMTDELTIRAGAGGGSIVTARLHLARGG